MKNKYLITGLAFMVWLTVFEQNNLITQVELTRTLHKLQQQKQYYLEEIRTDRQAYTELKTNLRNLEKFGREKYLMKKDDEDIYLVVKEENNPSGQ